MVVPYVQTKPYFIRFPIQLGYFICYRLSWAIDYIDMVITCESCDNWDTHGTNTIISAFPHGYPHGMMCSVNYDPKGWFSPKTGQVSRIPDFPRPN